MYGAEIQLHKLFSYLSPESRFSQSHPIRGMANKTLKKFNPSFRELYAKTGRLTIPPEQLRRSLSLQTPYSIRIGTGNDRVDG